MAEQSKFEHGARVRVMHTNSPYLGQTAEVRSWPSSELHDDYHLWTLVFDSGEVMFVEDYFLENGCALIRRDSEGAPRPQAGER